VHILTNVLGDNDFFGKNYDTCNYFIILLFYLALIHYVSFCYSFRLMI